jgi:hypothetical protein
VRHSIGLTSLPTGGRRTIQARTLETLEENDDISGWTAKLNGELRAANLLCRGGTKDASDRCADKQWDSVGFLSPLEVERREMGRLLTVRTSVGILCGWDESAYAYERRGERWERIWETEQAIGSGASYRPQYITGVRVSRAEEKTGDRLILSLGHMGWCSSYLYPVYFRMWRVKASGQATLLLDEEQPAYLGQHIPPIEGSIGQNGALVEFTVPSVDRAIHFYESIWHYKVIKDKVERIDPVALNPRDFVDEWLHRNWRDSSEWVPKARRTALRSWHAKLRDKEFAGRYIDAAQRCTKAADEWQIGIDFGDPDKSTDNACFLVRWRPPYHFDMKDIRSEPRSDCNRVDQATGSLETLFPVQ